jgi:hypothetical protein
MKPGDQMIMPMELGQDELLAEGNSTFTGSKCHDNKTYNHHRTEFPFS